MMEEVDAEVMNAPANPISIQSEKNEEQESQKESLGFSIESESDYSGSPCSDDKFEVDADESGALVDEEDEDKACRMPILGRRPSPPKRNKSPAASFCEGEIECPICVSLFCEPVSAAYPCHSLLYSWPIRTRHSREFEYRR